jgi:pectate lyase
MIDDDHPPLPRCFPRDLRCFALFLPMKNSLCRFLGGFAFALTSALVAHAASQALTSITLQELEPGICDPVMFEAKGTGYTGAGYINTPNDQAARINWSVKSPAGGPHTLEIRFANGSKAARPGVLEVNGGAHGKFDVALPPTGTFAQWQTATLNVGLIAGENTLALQAITDGGLANIDYLKVTGANPSPGNCGQPEPAAGPAAPVDWSYLNAPPVGWVTQGDGVTGGGNARPVFARSMSELQTHATGVDPKVIHVDGKLRGTLTVGSNKTIIGLQGAEIRSEAGALRLTGSRNVIIKNLTLVGVHQPNQPNTVLHDVKNVWLDHNTFINGSHDLLVVSGTSDFVTLSWNVFRHTIFGHDHMGVNIGASDRDPTSRGRLRVTHHHNFYAKMVNERMPRVRFGQVHTFNNLCLAGTDPQSRSYYAVRPGNDANVRSERNIYKDFVGPSWWWTSEKLGAKDSTVFNYARGNANSVLESIEDVAIPEAVKGPIAIKEHEGVTGQAGFYGNGKAFVPPYAYAAEPTDGLEEKIRAGAGAR